MIRQLGGDYLRFAVLPFLTVTCGRSVGYSRKLPGIGMRSTALR
jgi:hypothetical protein